MTLISSQIGGLDWSYSFVQMGNRWAKFETLPKVHPKVSLRMPYWAVLESRHEIALDHLNFATNWTNGMES